MVLEPLYEQEFLECSYGFRSGRSAHDAVQSLWEQLISIGDGWIIDLDIWKFFDTMEHACLRSILKRRVRDGVISSMLSNIYLHEALDMRLGMVVEPRLKGKAFLVRYANDAILGFSCKEDALRVMEVLWVWFGKYGLRIHPENTKMVRFSKPKSKQDTNGNKPKRESFDFLGFTRY